MIEFSPKANFTQGPSASLWTDITSSKPFTDAASAAMLQLHGNLGLAGTQADAMANWYKLEGARAFFAILMNLTTPPEEMPKRVRTDNLDHSV